MCGRYYRRSDKQRIAECFSAHPTSDLTDLVPDYNVAPTTFQPVIRNSRDGAVRELLLMHGLFLPGGFLLCLWASVPLTFSM